MAVNMPSVETLTIITGIGGWAGVWHAIAVYFEEGPLMVDRAFKMAMLPLFWGSASIIGYVGGINAINLSASVLGCMFHPIPFAIHIILMSLVISVLSAYEYIRQAFKSSAQQVAEEIAADTAAAAAADADDHTEEEEETEESDAEEHNDVETDGEDGEGGEDGEDGAQDETKANTNISVLDKALPDNDSIDEGQIGDVAPTIITDPVGETQRLDAELDTYAVERAAMRQTVHNVIDTVVDTNTTAIAGAISVSPVP